jgi:hypothetical protein
MDLQILFFTVTYRIIHVTVMSHSRDDYRKKRIKAVFQLYHICGENKFIFNEMIMGSALY